MSLALDVAREVCRGLAAEAVVHGDRCTWFGPQGESFEDLALGTLGADLYGGLAGVAWAMAETAAVAGDGPLADVARRALRQADAVAARDGTAPGLHDGAAGIALAAARLARLLDWPEARAIALRWAAHGDGGDDEVPPDLVSGAPGRALGLMATGRLLGRDGLTAAGVREAAAAAALRPPDTGLAHGAAGVALAVAEAGRIDGDGRRRAVAAALRDEAAAAAAAGLPPWHLRGGRWCRGTAGMLLAVRRTGVPVPGDHLAAAEALLGRTVDARLATVGADMCLCHGLAGDVEVLRLAGDAGDRPGRVAAAIADQIAGGAGVTLTSPGGPGPGLMTGLAGVAAFLVRTHDPAVPTPLLVTPDLWAT